MNNLAIYFSIGIFFCCKVLLAQAPFITLVKEPRFIDTTAIVEGKALFKAVDDTEKIKQFYGQSNTKVADEIKATSKESMYFFNDNGISYNLLSKGLDRASINSQVLHYKLFVGNPTAANTKRKYRYNIPLLLIAKLSSSYDSLNASNALDVLDYQAAPVTLRIMPSFKKSFESYSDVIYYGFYTDLRGLNIHSPINNNYTMEFIGSSGVGITYQADGFAGNYNSKGEYEQGKYSTSLILQTSYGDKDVISSIFKTNKGYTTSLQIYFLFYVKENSHLNFKLGYQNFFQETISGVKHNFSLSMGI